LDQLRIDPAGAAESLKPGDLQLQQQHPEFNKDAWKEYYEQDEDGDVQLHLAIASGYVEVVHALIRMAPHPDYLSIQNNAMYAPLHIAVLQNQPSVARRLVIAGARLDIQDHEGNTPLHLAARRGNVECGEALLNPVSVQECQQAELPAHLCNPLQAGIIDIRNHAGEHAVHLATMGGHIHFLRFLCWNNADMNIPAGRAGRSALHFAVGAKNMAAIQCLIEPRPSGCGVNVNQPDWYGRSAYQLALLNGSEEIANFLALHVAGIDTTPFIEDSTPVNSSEEEPCETEDWSLKKSPSVLLNSNA
jgi:ankyrin only family protein